MYQQENRKIPFTRSDFVKNVQRLLLTQSVLLIVLSISMLIVTAVWTAITLSIFGAYQLIVWLIILAVALGFGGVTVYMCYVTVKTNLPLLCLLTGKYAVEIDCVQRIELRSERNYGYRRSLIGKLSKADYVTWQYVCFEKYGEIKIDPKAEFAQDAEYYVLVALTKTPKILDFRACEKYELIDR